MTGLPQSSDVNSAEDFLAFCRAMHIIGGRLGYEAFDLSRHTRAMLRKADKVSGEDNRAQVARPLLAAAAAYHLGARYSKVAAWRMQTHYPHLVRPVRRTTTRRKPGTGPSWVAA